MDKELIVAMATINDAIIQGRRLRIILEIFENDNEDLPVVDVTILEKMGMFSDEETTVFSDLGFETIEEVLLAIGNGI